MKLPSLSAQESVLITLAEKYLSNLLPAKLSKSLNGHFTQARKTLYDYHSAINTKDRDWLSRIAIVSPTQPLLPPEISDTTMAIVSNALLESSWLLVDYKNSHGHQQEYRVMPLALVQQDVRLYLVCRFDGYDNERNLALHRLVNAKSQTLTVKYPSDFCLNRYVADGRLGIGDGRKIQLEFTIEEPAGRHLLETPLSKDQTVTEKNELLKVSTTVADSEILDRWLRTFGSAIKSVQKTNLDKDS